MKNEPKPQTVECSPSDLLTVAASLNSQGAVITGKTLLDNGLLQLTVEWPDIGRGTRV
jgi:hypothetical protein